MKTLMNPAIFVASLLTAGSQPAVAAGPFFETSPVVTPAASSLVERVERALLQYAQGCAAGHGASSQALTDTAVIEYATPAAGRFVATDAAAGGTCWEGATLLNRTDNLHVWIYPTDFANTVFVQYSTEDGSVAAQDHLAMIEMDGSLIARIRDFTSTAMN